MISLFTVKLELTPQSCKNNIETSRRKKKYSKKSKRSFGKKEIEFLGCIVSANDIKIGPKKIMAITEWSSPKSIALLSIFLVLTCYYRKIVRNYAQIVAPLTSLLKRDDFRWDKDA